MARHLVLPRLATPVGDVQALRHEDGTATFVMSDIKDYGGHAGAEHLLYVVGATVGGVAGSEMEVWEEEVKAGRAERFTEIDGNRRRSRMLPPAQQAA